MNPLITAGQRALLLANGAAFARNEDFDPHPVLKLFTPDGSATWLLASLDPDAPDVAFACCDLGLGSPELGSVLSEITAVRGRLGLPVERDLHFVAEKPLSACARETRVRGAVVTG